MPIDKNRHSDWMEDQEAPKIEALKQYVRSDGVGKHPLEQKLTQFVQQTKQQMTNLAQQLSQRGSRGTPVQPQPQPQQQSDQMSMSQRIGEALMMFGAGLAPSTEPLVQQLFKERMDQQERARQKEIQRKFGDVLRQIDKNLPENIGELPTELQRGVAGLDLNTAEFQLREWATKHGYQIYDDGTALHVFQLNKEGKPIEIMKPIPKQQLPQLIQGIIAGKDQPIYLTAVPQSGGGVQFGIPKYQGEPIGVPQQKSQYEALFDTISREQQLIEEIKRLKAELEAARKGTTTSTLKPTKESKPGKGSKGGQKPKLDVFGD